MPLFNYVAWSRQREILNGIVGKLATPIVRSKPMIKAQLVEALMIEYLQGNYPGGRKKCVDLVLNESEMRMLEACWQDESAIN